MANKKKNSNKIFEVTVYGTVRVQGGPGGFEDKAYEYTFKCTGAQLQETSALSIFKNAVAPQHFPILYPGFQTLMTHYVKSTSCPEDPEAIYDFPSILNRKQLVSYIMENELPVDEMLYPDVEVLRQAVNDCENNDPEVFRKMQEWTREHRGNASSNIRVIDELNPLPTKTADKLKEEQALQEKADAEAKAKADAELLAASAEYAKTKADAEANAKVKADPKSDSKADSKANANANV